jgi:NAD(P)-dependent dehydrogenase (short-subunit alcohol dehydrogenase family)
VQGGGSVGRLGTCFEDALLVLCTNAVAPLMVAQQFLGSSAPAARRGWCILRVRLGVGEHGRHPTTTRRQGGAERWTRLLAAEARRSRIIAVVVDPGWVSTEPVAEAPVTPARSVGGLMRVLDGLTARDNGRF